MLWHHVMCKSDQWLDGDPRGSAGIGSKKLSRTTTLEVQHFSRLSRNYAFSRTLQAWQSQHFNFRTFEDFPGCERTLYWSRLSIYLRCVDALGELFSLEIAGSGTLWTKPNPMHVHGLFPLCFCSKFFNKYPLHIQFILDKKVSTCVRILTYEKIMYRYPLPAVQEIYILMLHIGGFRGGPSRPRPPPLATDRRRHCTPDKWQRYCVMATCSSEYSKW